MVAPASRILIVDDEPDTCANLSDIFTDFGYQVDTAYDGFQALELVQKKPYDVALLDLRMPGMDGLELYRRIREISAGTVAIVVTAYAGSDTATAARAAGAWQIVPKPVSISKLMSVVNEALDTPLVLVVDDDRDLCDNLWDLLREQGFRVHLAHDIPEAERMLSEPRAFQVVLIDMKLPAGDGILVLRLLQQHHQDARAVLITGHSAEMEAKVQEALSAGANAVCYKPFDVDQLLSTINELSARKPQSS